VIIVVDANGKAYPANSIQFGSGFTVDHVAGGLAKIEPTDLLEVTHNVTRQKPVTLTQEITRERTRIKTSKGISTAEVTKELTSEREFTTTKLLGTVTTHHVYQVTDEKLVTVTGEPLTITRDAPGTTVTKESTVTREITQ
jgi:hypothetical protein